MTTLTCYNQGCGEKFTEEENKDGICQHHPGGPVFHDAYKGWSCCKKRSTDFTEFLNIAGCTKAKHNPIKPVQIEKKKEKPLDVGEVVKDGPKLMKQKPPVAKVERPSDEIPKMKLKSTIAGSLKTALQKYKEKLELEKLSLNANENDNSIQVGAPCKHNSCDTKFVTEDSDNSACVHHPGYPVFHEGYKFWTCCNKRTSDFNEFLKQGGCENGKHEWMKPSEVAEKKSTCRYDWHQTGNNVLISVYAKTCDPDKCLVEANPTNLHAIIAFNGGSNTFELDLNLNGVIDPGASSVEYMGTKVEIKMKKLEPFSWPKLEFTKTS